MHKSSVCDIDLTLGHTMLTSYINMPPSSFFLSQVYHNILFGQGMSILYFIIPLFLGGLVLRLAVLYNGVTLKL